MAARIIHGRRLVYKSTPCSRNAKMRNDPSNQDKKSKDLKALRNRLGRPALSSGLLDRLVRVARQTGIHLTELRQLGNIAFISHSGVLRLNLENLRQRLCS